MPTFGSTRSVGTTRPKRSSWRSRIDIHKKYGLSKIINAAGTFTPFGVSRSTDIVGKYTSQALTNFFLIDELQAAASMAIARWTGARAGAVTHCAAAAITLSIAAVMTGTDAHKIAALPDTGELPNRVVLPANHVINYGQSILQAIRLAGAIPVVAGTAERCTAEDLQTQLNKPRTVCLLLVSSRLVTGEHVDLNTGVAVAHEMDLPVIIDCAAQDMRIPELLQTKADLLLVSAHKYLASPTAGLIIGDTRLVEAARAQEKGIGRAMKPSKEAIIGVLAAIEQREKNDPDVWKKQQESKLVRFIQQANRINGLNARSIPDIAGMPFSRACLTLDHPQLKLDATALAELLEKGTPSIRVMEYALAQNEIMLELVALHQTEIECILDRLSEIISG